MDRSQKENYSVGRNNFRWPLTVFYSSLNIGDVNAQIIFKKTVQRIKKKESAFF